MCLYVKYGINQLYFIAGIKYIFIENFIHSVLLIFRPRFDLITERLNQLLQLTDYQQMDIYSLNEDFYHFTSDD